MLLWIFFELFLSDKICCFEKWEFDFFFETLEQVGFLSCRRGFAFVFLSMIWFLIMKRKGIFKTKKLDTRNTISDRDKEDHKVITFSFFLFRLQLFENTRTNNLI